MFLKLGFFSRHVGLTGTLIPPLCLLLSACGGDGSFVASVPPPPPTPTPTPTPTPSLAAGTVTYVYPSTNPVHIVTSWLNSPATTAGTSDLIGRLTMNAGTGSPNASTYRATAPGEFTMTTSANDKAWDYTLNAPAGILPGSLTTTQVPSPYISWDINSTVAYRYTNTYGDTPQYLGQRLTGEDALGASLFSYDYTRGASGFAHPFGPGTNLVTALDYDIGYSYVAMGEWSWRVVDVSGNTVPGTQSGQLLFVNGDRTPASGIPVTGTATYDARSLQLRSSSGALGIPFTLTADFGLRTISTRIDQDFRNFGSDDPIQGIHVGGNAPFNNSGSFDIPLSGTVNYSYQNMAVPPPSQPVTGDMNGAFFGPNAEQVGGTFELHRDSEAVLYQDAFVGQQRHP